jgi:YD repeat-containing protein
MRRILRPWDANGNLTNDGVRSYSYDHANRLTQVTEGSLRAQFAYNGDGVRTSKTTGGPIECQTLS